MHWALLGTGVWALVRFVAWAPPHWALVGCGRRGGGHSSTLLPVPRPAARGPPRPPRATRLGYLALASCRVRETVLSRGPVLSSSPLSAVPMYLQYTVHLHTPYTVNINVSDGCPADLALVFIDHTRTSLIGRREALSSLSLFHSLSTTVHVHVHACTCVKTSLRCTPIPEQEQRAHCTDTDGLAVAQGPPLLRYAWRGHPLEA